MQNSCDKTNTLSKIKNCAEYTTICIHYLPRMGYSTRNKQQNRKKSSTQRNSEQKPTTISRKKCDLTMNNHIVIHRNQQE